MRKNKRTEKHRELKRTAERWLISLGFDVYHEQFVYCREPEKGYKSRHRIDLVGVNSSGLKMGVECGLISRLVICETRGAFDIFWHWPYEAFRPHPVGSQSCCKLGKRHKECKWEGKVHIPYY